LIKPNQIGTLTVNAGRVKNRARERLPPRYLSRSGETEDSTIADLAVATGAGQIKIGSIARSEALANISVLRIEQSMAMTLGFDFLGNRLAKTPVPSR